MHILYLTEEPISFSEPVVRGGQIHVRNVVRGLRNRGHEVSLIDWNGAPDRPFQRSITPWLRFVVDPVRTFFRAVSSARGSRVDAVVSKTRKTYLPGIAAAKEIGVPHIVHVGSSPGTPGDNMYDRIDRVSVASRLKMPHDGYFVVCDALGDDIRRLGVPGSRIFDVKNAVDTERFHPDCIHEPLKERYRSQLDGFDDDRFVCGFVGGLQPYKGLADLAAALNKTDTECGVVIAGDGPERNRLERQFGEQATFLGPVPYEQIPAVYDVIDAFVLPSHTEGLPRVILEAQASGVPVVATHVGGVPEIVDDGETGLLVDPKCPSQLATSIDKLAGSPELCVRLARNGRAMVVDSYRWETLYERYERYLEKVVHRSG